MPKTQEPLHRVVATARHHIRQHDEALAAWVGANPQLTELQAVLALLGVLAAERDDCPTWLAVPIRYQDAISDLSKLDWFARLLARITHQGGVSWRQPSDRKERNDLLRGTEGLYFRCFDWTIPEEDWWDIGACPAQVIACRTVRIVTAYH